LSLGGWSPQQVSERRVEALAFPADVDAMPRPQSVTELLQDAAVRSDDELRAARRRLHAGLAFYVQEPTPFPHRTVTHTTVIRAWAESRGLAVPTGAIPPDVTDAFYAEQLGLLSRTEQLGTPTSQDDEPSPPVSERPCKMTYVPRFKLDSIALDDGAPTWPAVRFGEPWNGWAAPVVTRQALSSLLDFITAQTDEPHHWDGDVAVISGPVDAAGEPSYWDRLAPLSDGTYNLGELGWAFVEAV
jgi:hypothetical protein